MKCVDHATGIDRTCQRFTYSEEIIRTTALVRWCQLVMGNGIGKTAISPTLPEYTVHVSRLTALVVTGRELSFVGYITCFE